MSLTMKEKEHWKTRIAERIGKAIESTYLKAGIEFKEELKRRSEVLAIERLGIEKAHTDRQRLRNERDALDEQIEQMEEQMETCLVRLGYKIECHWRESTLRRVIEEKAEQVEKDILLESLTGREVLRLEKEREQLLDTVWLATSPIHIRRLWSNFNEMLGEEPTELQQKTLREDSPKETE